MQQLHVDAIDMCECCQQCCQSQTELLAVSYVGDPIDSEHLSGSEAHCASSFKLLGGIFLQAVKGFGQWLHPQAKGRFETDAAPVECKQGGRTQDVMLLWLCAICVVVL
jgi:hypothetical protein